MVASGAISTYSIASICQGVSSSAILAVGTRKAIVRRSGLSRNPIFQRTVLAQLSSADTLMRTVRPYPQWNDYVVVAYRNHIVTALNGYMMTDTVDDDPRAPAEGHLGFQLHARYDVSAQFKDVFIALLACWSGEKRLCAPTRATFSGNPGSLQIHGGCAWPSRTAGRPSA